MPTTWYSQRESGNLCTVEFLKEETHRLFTVQISHCEKSIVEMKIRRRYSKYKWHVEYCLWMKLYAGFSRWEFTAIIWFKILGFLSFRNVFNKIWVLKGLPNSHCENFIVGMKRKDYKNTMAFWVPSLDEDKCIIVTERIHHNNQINRHRDFFLLWRCLRNVNWKNTKFSLWELSILVLQTSKGRNA